MPSLEGEGEGKENVMHKMAWKIVLLMYFSDILAVKHSLQYFCTAASGIPDIPEFVSVGMVDGEPFCYYDSNMRREIPKQEWAKEAVDPHYWERNTQISHRVQHCFKFITAAMKSINQTVGVHTLQNMFGCEWDEETNSTDGYDRYGYDGEDFFTFDLKNIRWIPKVQQATQIKLEWESRIAQAEEKKYLIEVCIDWLKKYVNCGQSTLERKVSPQVTAQLPQMSPFEEN
ncbi:hypothetical protein MATL_G00192920 [Megalops atlanticus]|uniref:MHC class I-like antigen recognition-like domain-containing protein n=1 Tax=Megalops atlanticus TaxID=7932 RepID=A0A9D3PMW0_MEGAT|nr:hypothetical protein MATL_G00192920 [Megalops atlanticus]